jgi:uncharacterized integral membrane protein
MLIGAKLTGMTLYFSQQVWGVLTSKVIPWLAMGKFVLNTSLFLVSARAIGVRWEITLPVLGTYKNRTMIMFYEYMLSSILLWILFINSAIDLNKAAIEMVSTGTKYDVPIILSLVVISVLGWVLLCVRYSYIVHVDESLYEKELQNDVRRESRAVSMFLFLVQTVYLYTLCVISYVIANTR